MTRRFIAAILLAGVLVLAAGACKGNTAPTANAGSDVEARIGVPVKLSGEGSTDVDINDELTYRWEIVARPDGSSATLADADTISPALDTDVAGSYELELVVNDGTDDSEPSTVVVRANPWFTDVTDAAGVPGPAAGATDTAYGTGASWGDYDNDGDPDLFVCVNGPNLLYRNNGDGTFTDVAAQAGVDNPGESYAAAWFDGNNDGNLDLLVTNSTGVGIVLYTNNGDGTFRDVTHQAGIDRGIGGLAVATADYNSDGWTDLFITSPGYPDEPGGESEPDILLRNNGDGHFEEVAIQVGVSGADVRFDADLSPREPRPGYSFGAVWFDYDLDNDADLFVARERGVSTLYENAGVGFFVDITEKAGLAVEGRARGAVSGDYDNDGDLDLFVTDHDGNRLWKNNGDGTFTNVADDLSLAGTLAGWGAGFIDVNNDGHLDLYVANGSPRAGGGPDQPNRLHVYCGGEGVCEDMTSVAGVGHEGSSRAVAFADYDGDGDLDMYVTNVGGRNVLYRNEIGSEQNWLRARIVGTRSARTGVGARLTVTTPDLITRTAPVAGSGGYMGQNAMELLFGLGESDRADVNIKWIGGVSQDFWDSLANRTFTATEGVLEGSCPMVFAWDGTTYEYVSDVLGSAVTGFYMGPAEVYAGVYRFPIDTDEYLRLPDARPRDDVYSVRIVELLNEIGYMDHARLVVIDHPSGVEVYPNEALMLVPPFPEPVLHVVKDARPVVSATDEKGNDILDLVSTKDGIYAETFEYLPYEGFAEEHSTILDLGDLSGADKILLVLHGWTHYVTCFSVDEGFENGVPPMLPRLDVLDENGDWVPATMNMGMPAGQPKTTTFDLTGLFLTDEYKIRITTNLQIFYDQILVSTYAGDEAPRITELEATRAELSRKGYPVNRVATGRRGRTAAQYDYDVVDEAKEWWTVWPGDYTRYGDVTPLMAEIDDMFVVFRHGDEIALDFDAGSLPELPAGWERSVVLYVDGYFRYLDSKSALYEDGFNVAPMPFHDMSAYPYPEDESYPDDEAHRRYLEEYNTRREP